MVLIVPGELSQTTRHMNLAKRIKDRLHEEVEKGKAPALQRFFKTGSGEYAEGDIFIGVKVPVQRSIAKEFGKEVGLEDIRELLKDRIHEYRLTALFLLIHYYQRNKKDPGAQKKAVDLYVECIDHVDNWDLVDSSAHKILGAWLEDKDKKLLYELARTDHLWKQRIAIIATLDYIRKGRFTETLEISKILLNHPHDLIHKAVGWMLRELGKVDHETEVIFLNKHYQHMPRTMLRYAIERFPEDLRQDYLKGRI